MKEAGMSKKVVSKRARYSEEFKAEALQLMERVGAKAATEKLGLRDGQLYAWKAAKRKQMASSEVEQEQQQEIARLKRRLAEQEEELAILKKAAAYFAKGMR